jgi:hypothetical protein
MVYLHSIKVLIYSWVVKLLAISWDKCEQKDKYSIIFSWNSCQNVQVTYCYFKIRAWRRSWTGKISVGTVITLKCPGKILETATLEDGTTMSSPNIGNQLHSYPASRPETTENSNTVLPKPKISQHLVLLLHYLIDIWLWVGPVAQSVYRLARGWTVRGSNPGGVEIFHTCPDRSWGSPSMLYNGYRVFPGGKERPGRDADPSPLLVPWSWKGRALPLLPLRAVRPVQSRSACTRVQFTFTFLFDSERFYTLINYENQPTLKKVLCSHFVLCSTNFLRYKLVSTIC